MTILKIYIFDTTAPFLIQYDNWTVDSTLSCQMSDRALSLTISRFKSTTTVGYCENRIINIKTS